MAENDDISQTTGPSEPRSNDRDEKGRFLKSNRCGVPFEPGNTYGRMQQSERKPLTAMLKAFLNQDDPNEPTQSQAARLVQALINQAGQGNMTAVREVFDRIEGRSVDIKEITQDAGIQVILQSLESGDAPPADGADPADEDNGEG